MSSRDNEAENVKGSTILLTQMQGHYVIANVSHSMKALVFRPKYFAFQNQFNTFDVTPRGQYSKRPASLLAVENRLVNKNIYTINLTLQSNFTYSEIRITVFVSRYSNLWSCVVTVCCTVFMISEGEFY